MVKRLLTALLVLVIVGAVGAAGGYFYWQNRLESPLTLEEPTLYQVPSGAGFNQVVAELEAQGILEDAWAFRLLARVEPERVPRLRTGEYQLPPDMSGLEMMALLGSNNVVTYPLTIPEGGLFARCATCLMRRRNLSTARLI
ncbi:hypothetical protein HSBAA_25410 [Vreelandella sulfidaeris]|uniref:Aminodeoxychorismate lyase n=1 Tax=Vreelandella sulfidaeris TaxID=115553 RepID=A0A455U5L0_9GAMM|nr:hypothetical protein HSBAA_25410 [Halomonas sulfidaeris]